MVMSGRSPTAVDVFSGCGGLTSGLKAAGFTVISAIEIDPAASDCYSQNHPEVSLTLDDIRNVDPKSMIESDLPVDLVAGCPPCQGFSRIRTKNRSTAVFDARNDLIFEFQRIILALKPKVILLENVPGLKDDGRFARFTSDLSGYGYNFCSEVVDAADYGVAQRRKRLIAIGSRIHSPSIALNSCRQRTVREVIGSLGSVKESSDVLHSWPERRSEKVRDLIAKIPKDGGSRSDLPPSMHLACHRKSNGFSDVYGRMSWDKPSPTITSGCSNPSKGRFIHPEENRAITLREAALLQGFDPKYRFDPRYGKEALAAMIGNAIPPKLVELQARPLSRAIMGYESGQS